MYLRATIPIKTYLILLTFALVSAVSRAEEKLDLTYGTAG